MKTIKIHDIIYQIVGDNLNAIEDLDIADATIRTRLLRGWTLEEACQVPKGLNRRDLEYINFAKAYEEDTQEATLDYRDEKLRKEKPHLFNGTPQKHRRGKWCEYLMNTSIFPKVVR
ncbi:SA1788 family PVL leukocidin-associated protein [Staphylococcus edaphicus]|uniref:Uncharacterized protein n=1 Tax=Staphylococcus edaphicus TaxID=1955013 RepID=A0A2C6WSK1_9STAP|nr:SA1788 family PVL leukocidin-associated protein [Staphylococcus edaphicus]PHK50764.1 hypothetical protein BTJ66_00215 [Staphylococcus edaphicus]UQW82455.1 hypothetical protein MNY58_05165 [Staphylococcus edaphicus]